MLKHFLNIMERYLKPYRKYLIGSVLLNFFSQWMNVFSFMVLIPILNILFIIDGTVYTYQEWSWEALDKDVLVNNGQAHKTKNQCPPLPAMHYAEECYPRNGWLCS